jgi:selenocysteine lyase/cysteine desulfurase
MAKLMHQYDGFAFIDFACSAPYLDINMHPDDPEEKLDAITLSPHKFLGGPGSSGVLIFDSKLYQNKVPDQPGGGTVDWTNPWGQHKFVSNIELREDGGTPAFLQAIRAALSIRLKEEMGVDKMKEREKELVQIAFAEMRKIPGLHILADDVEERLGAMSFYVDDIHYNLLVKILNDKYGIQVRGGCSCAGTYGHYLLHVNPDDSKRITDKINIGDLSEKPGWVRISIHPTMTNGEVYYIINAIKEIAANIGAFRQDYIYDIHKNEFFHISSNTRQREKIKSWFYI